MKPTGSRAIFAESVADLIKSGDVGTAALAAPGSALQHLQCPGVRPLRLLLELRPEFRPPGRGGVPTASVRLLVALPLMLRAICLTRRSQNEDSRGVG